MQDVLERVFLKSHQSAPPEMATVKTAAYFDFHRTYIKKTKENQPHNDL